MKNYTKAILVVILQATCFFVCLSQHSTIISSSLDPSDKPALLLAHGNTDFSGTDLRADCKTRDFQELKQNKFSLGKHKKKWIL